MSPSSHLAIWNQIVALCWTYICSSKLQSQIIIICSLVRLVNSSLCTAVNRLNLNEASSIFLFVQHFKDFNCSSVHLKWRAPSPVPLALWHYANVHPLASRPLCSLPVIRLDYALLAVNALSANKFTMSIIIFRSSSTGKGQRGGQVSAGTFTHNNTAQWQHV